MISNHDVFATYAEQKERYGDKMKVLLITEVENDKLYRFNQKCSCVKW